MQSIKELNLTENDFDLLVKGLDKLPNDGIIADALFSGLMGSMIKDEDDKADFERKREKERAEKELQQKLVEEEVRILQGKLLQMKRYMIQNNLLTRVHEIVEDHS